MGVKMVKSGTMDLQSLLNSRRAGILALRLSRVIPPGLGCLLADTLADRIASRRQLPMVQAIRANQWVISGGQLDSSQLDTAVSNSVRHIAQSFYTLFHNINDLEGLWDHVCSDPQAEGFLERIIEAKEGLVLVGVHLGNFDLVLQLAGLLGMRGIVLSLPKSGEAIEWQHNIRRHAGVDIVPATLSNLRDVIQRVKDGETVITGVDRPMEGLKYHPMFFGRPASIPVHYISIALRAKVPLVLMASIIRSDGKVHILISDFIEMQSYSDRRTELLYNAERVLEIAAEFISQAPHQWSVIKPVWPEVIEEVP